MPPIDGLDQGRRQSPAFYFVANRFRRQLKMPAPARAVANRGRAAGTGTGLTSKVKVNIVWLPTTTEPFGYGEVVILIPVTFAPGNIIFVNMFESVFEGILTEELVVAVNTGVQTSSSFNAKSKVTGSGPEFTRKKGKPPTDTKVFE